jgi:maltose/moltooligosaccharide transporter
MKKKPILSFWQLWNMSFGYIGIQFGFALQNSNLSRIFETLGAKQDGIPALWIAAPLSGLIIQPIIGYMSDRTWNRLGRRKPYFLTGAILASLALFILPNSSALWIAAGMLWMLDASINITMEPMRAFVGDMLSDEQRTQGFAMQTFFIGAASIVGSLLPYLITNLLKVPNTAPEGIVPPSVRFAFYTGGIIYICAILWTIFSTKEYSPEEHEAFHAHETDDAAKEGDDMVLDTKKYYTSGFLYLIIGLIATFIVYQFDWDKALYILSIAISAYGLLQLITAKLFVSGHRSGLVEIIYDMNNMPKGMTQLALVTLFTWFSLFAMWIYSTNAITSTKYNMKVDKAMVTVMQTDIKSVLTQPTVDAKTKNEFESLQDDINEINKYRPNDNPVTISVNLSNHYGDSANTVFPANDKAELKRVSKQYNDGADWVGVLNGVYNGVAALIAFLLPIFAKRLTRVKTHVLCLFAGGIGYISMYIFNDPKLLIISMIGVGIAWAGLLTFPYAILSSIVPQKKMGVYMGMFNYFVVIPQIVAAAILGLFVRTIFNGNAIDALVMGGVSMLIAGVLMLFVKDKKEAL